MPSGTRCLIMIGLVLCSACAFGVEHPQLKAFPAAEDGMERFVIVLPHVERGDDNDLKVELIPGKVMLTDGVNQVRLGTSLEARPLVGWGYTFYEVTGKDVAMSTMMAVPEGTEQKEQFVPGSPLLIRYNSRLPIVVYAPKGQEIRYRIWSAEETTRAADIN